MKTSNPNQAPDEGNNGGGSGAGPSPETMMQEAIKHATAQQQKQAAAPADGPHYGDGSTYGSGVRYAVTDPVVPVSDGALVKMDLASRNSDNLQAYIGNHIFQMDENVNFPTPQPPAPAFLVLYQTFQTALVNVLAAKTAYEDAISAREAARASLVEAANTRAAYVQTTSNGNANVIISSGLNVRNARTPVGQLSAPTSLTATLNHTAGLVRLTWKPVSHARGYVVECSPDVQPRVFSLLSNTTKANAEKQLATGETYVFRVAASGGSTGQSYYSPEVIRGAA